MAGAVSGGRSTGFAALGAGAGAAAGTALTDAPASAPGGGAGTGPDPSEATPEEDGAEFTPDYADETVESVGMVGTAAIEKILGGTVIEEHSDQA